MNSGAFDPLRRRSPTCCAAHGAWLHVDGAFGLWAAASPSLRHLVDDVDRADSWATDCHKWLNVPYDSAVVFVRDPEAHAAAMTWQTSYVTPGEGREPYRYVPEASRRARGFAVWAAIAEMGADGIADLVDRCCANARRFAGLMAAEPGVEILNDVVLNQVVVRFGDSDEVTHDVSARVQAEGTCWLGGTDWNGRDARAVLDHQLVDDRRGHRPLGGRDRRGLSRQPRGDREGSVDELKCGGPCYPEARPAAQAAGASGYRPSASSFAHMSQRGRSPRPGRLSRGSMW